jgi:hypothetical protein
VSWRDEEQVGKHAVRTMRRAHGRVVRITPKDGDPGLVAYECPKCGYVTSVLVECDADGRFSRGT